MSNFLKKNVPLISFILGILMVVAIMPVASSFSELICQWVEYFKTTPIKKTGENNIKITRIQRKLEEENTPSNTNIIGFEVPEPEEVYGDYCCKNKHKIGF